jgi:flavin reductase (DIM6/NTAB) family NADH-FMN oxidoreductase RutF
MKGGHVKTIEWSEGVQRLKDALSTGGAFLVAKDAAGKPNPMTIGWAQIGIVWSMPVMTVFVRKSRYTHACISRSETFSVCGPRSGELGDALAFCGTTSGRDVDKAVKAGLTLVPGRSIDTPIVAECGLHYESRIVARTQQVRDDFAAAADGILSKYYLKGDHHLAVLGRIVDAYTT